MAGGTQSNVIDSSLGTGQSTEDAQRAHQQKKTLCSQFNVWKHPVSRGGCLLCGLQLICEWRKKNGLLMVRKVLASQSRQRDVEFQKPSNCICEAQNSQLEEAGLSKRHTPCTSTCPTCMGGDTHHYRTDVGAGVAIPPTEIGVGSSLVVCQPCTKSHLDCHPVCGTMIPLFYGAQDPSPAAQSFLAYARHGPSCGISTCRQQRCGAIQ